MTEPSHSPPASTSPAPVDSGARRRRGRRAVGWLVVALVLTGVLAATVGAGGFVAPWTVVRVTVERIAGGEPDTGDPTGSLVLIARLPRLALGILVGCALSVSGAVMQGVFRNPLADPYLLGIAGGGTAGAALAIALGFGGSTALISLGAFAGGVAAVSAVYRLSLTRLGRLSDYTLILAGVAIASLSGAVTSFLVYIADSDDLRRIIFFMLGSLSGATFADASLPILLVVVAVGCAALLLLARDLNALMLGDDMATHLGVDPQTLKKLLLVVTTAMTTTVVAMAGIIGFVGLIVPHVVRLVLGPDHRVLLVASALAGATFLVLCDTAARTVIPTLELPVGIITAMIGAPFLVWLLRRPRSAAAAHLGGAALSGPSGDDD